MHLINVKEQMKSFNSGLYDKELNSIYTYPLLNHVTQNYLNVLSRFESLFDDRDIVVLSVPGGCRLCGNFTEYQGGYALATAVSNDMIGIASRSGNKTVRIVFEAIHDISFSIDDIRSSSRERDPFALIAKGVFSYFINNSCKVGGINLYVKSSIPQKTWFYNYSAIGVLIGNILNKLFEYKVSNSFLYAAVSFAENHYLKKSSSMLGQIACNEGDMIMVDFYKNDKPITMKIGPGTDELNLDCFLIDPGFSCQSFNSVYAKIVENMSKVAAVYKTDKLSKIDFRQFEDDIPFLLRSGISEAAVLQTLFYFDENRIVKKEAEALSHKDVDSFLYFVNQAGTNFIQKLQDLASCSSKNNQLLLAYALIKRVLQGNGAVSIHSNASYGYLLAFVKKEYSTSFINYLEKLFDKDDYCPVLFRRKGLMIF